MNLIARIFSIILQPIFVPLYGVILLTEYDPVLSVLPLSAKSMIWLIVFLSTGLFPAIVIGICIKYGLVSDTFISNRKQRPIPFVFTLFGRNRLLFQIHWIGQSRFQMF